jgi:pimeloyl-ACP methyl ester carboxylesterase
MSEDDLAAFRAAPSWPGRVAAAHTITREIRAEARAKLDSRSAAQITIPVLLVIGGESSDPAEASADAVCSALPDARITVLEGQGHVADALAPEMFARHILAFLREQP